MILENSSHATQPRVQSTGGFDVLCFRKEVPAEDMQK